MPDSAPPYDDEIQATRLGPVAVPDADDGDSPARPPRPRAAVHDGDKRAGTPGHDTTGGASENSDDRAGRGRDDRPPARDRPASDGATQPTPTWPSQFAQVLAETLAGSRPPRQLTPWTTERARGHIRRLGPLLAGSQEPRIRRIVASTPSSGVVEMAVVVRFGPRVRALAVRLERADSTRATAWQCTAIEAA
ncbi:MAG TPA: Rv3235 family protein [Streptosporangiaceae bacterium]|nr:Rv3235 family protein [Streptosporangiaceae bacterium]